MFDVEHTARQPLDVADDRVGVHRLHGERLENEHVEGALEQLVLRCRGFACWCHARGLGVGNLPIMGSRSTSPALEACDESAVGRFRCARLASLAFKLSKDRYAKDARMRLRVWIGYVRSAH